MPLTEVLAELDTPFHIIAFPALERTNIILHCLLGHELGHLLANRFLTDERRTAFVQSIMTDLEEQSKRDLEKAEQQFGPLFRDQLKDQVLTMWAELAGTIWTRALQELLSDVVGALLFGPATLFSSWEMGLFQGFDVPPTAGNNFYPPWRLRIRTVAGVCQEATPFFPVPATVFRSADRNERAVRVNDRIDYILGIAAGDADIKVIGADPLTRLCYEALPKTIGEATNYFLNDCGLKAMRLSAESLHHALPPLIERLDHWLPPNAVEDDPLAAVPADIAEIINTAWYVRMSWDQLQPGADDARIDEWLAQRAALNRLTLKAIEFSDLARSYRQYKGFA